MARTIVLQIEITLPEDPKQWEEFAYQTGCAVARQVGESLLQSAAEGRGW